MNPLILLPLLFLAACKDLFKPHRIECREVKDFDCKPCPITREDCLPQPCQSVDHYVDAGKKTDLELPDAGKDSYLDWDGEPKYHGGKW